MTNTIIQLTEEEFDERFTCIPNHLNPNAGWGYGGEHGCLFETFGEELEFVRQQDPRTIWTVVDGEDDDLHVLSGYHLVNRIGYLITTKPVPDGADYEVHIPFERDDESREVASNETADDRLAQIAREHLRIPTLDTRNSDSLDFYDVAVWCVKDALQAAFEAGLDQASRQSAGYRSACQMVVERWEHGDLAEAARVCAAALGMSYRPIEGPEADQLAGFDSYEVHGVREFDDGHGKSCEQVPDDQAQFWSLYGHAPGQGVECIGDFRTREHAEEVLARIAGPRYPLGRNR